MKLLVIQKSMDGGNAYPRAAFSDPAKWDEWREAKVKSWTAAGGRVSTNTAEMIVVEAGGSVITYKAYTLILDGVG